MTWQTWKHQGRRINLDTVSVESRPEANRMAGNCCRGLYTDSLCRFIDFGNIKIEYNQPFGPFKFGFANFILFFNLVLFKIFIEYLKI